MIIFRSAFLTLCKTHKVFGSYCPSGAAWIVVPDRKVSVPFYEALLLHCFPLTWQNLPWRGRSVWSGDRKFYSSHWAVITFIDFRYFRRVQPCRGSSAAVFYERSLIVLEARWDETWNVRPWLGSSATDSESHWKHEFSLIMWNISEYKFAMHWATWAVSVYAGVINVAFTTTFLYICLSSEQPFI